jgi:hypothetical protein
MAACDRARAAFVGDGRIKNSKVPGGWGCRPS